MICLKCHKYKIDTDGITYNQSCKIEKKIGINNIRKSCKSFKEISEDKQFKRKYDSFKANW